MIPNLHWDLPKRTHLMDCDLLILDQQSLMVNLDGGKLHLYFYQSKCPFSSIMNVDNKPQWF